MGTLFLENRLGVRVGLVPHGASIQSCIVPDERGDPADIVLGFDDAASYATNPAFFGCVPGRCANRIANAEFTIDGTKYRLTPNEGPHQLHGGPNALGHLAWEAETFDDPSGQGVVFTITSKAGDNGYPGTLHASAEYFLNERNQLILQLTATSDAPTICNLTQHTYWNLAGHDSGTVRDHLLKMHASRYTPTDPQQIPTGELRDVAGTPFDFREARPIGDDLLAAAGSPPGYDHNYEVEGEPLKLRDVAMLSDPTAGRSLAVQSNQPGVQLYTANNLDGSIVGKGGCAYPRYAGVCLETQTFPNAINTEGWLAPVLRPGETYKHVVVYSFGTGTKA